MNAQTQIAIPMTPKQLIGEYQEKLAALPDVLENFSKTVQVLGNAATVAGTFGGTIFSHGSPSPHLSTLEKSLRISAWRRAYAELKLDSVAPASERKQWQMAFENPPEFTLENLIASFGKYVGNQRFHILRGLAECFTNLDPAYKSHSKVKIGVKGLPKRIILTSLGHSGSWGFERLKDTLNALRAYRGLPNLDYRQISDFVAGAEIDIEALSEFDPEKSYRSGQKIRFDGRAYEATGFLNPAPKIRFSDESGSCYGFREILQAFPELKLKTFSNGNGHLIFDNVTLIEINEALAEFYGEVLPDMPAAPDTKRKASTEVSKDLAFYWTSTETLKQALRNVSFSDGQRVLEPSCGEGHIMDYLRALPNRLSVTGVEVDPGRVEKCRAKGHAVHAGNFLETQPTADFDLVVMNPPFAGKHWKKHLIHARKFLKKDQEQRWKNGTLVCILPATAHYDGHLSELLGFDPQWTDLPVASFSEAGTNVPTGYIVIGAGS